MFGFNAFSFNLLKAIHLNVTCVKKANGERVSRVLSLICLRYFMCVLKVLFLPGTKMRPQILDFLGRWTPYTASKSFTQGEFILILRPE